MTSINDLCLTLSRSLGCERTLPAHMAGALRMDADAPAMRQEAALLLIALLCAETPEQAAVRAPVYAGLPLADVQWLHPPMADGAQHCDLIAAEDIKTGPRNRETVIRTSRSLLSAIELFLERCAERNDAFPAPMLSLARRVQAPIAYVYSIGRSGLRETFVYRRPGDSDEAHAMARLRLNAFTEVHGVVLEAVADLLRGQPIPPAADPNCRLRPHVRGRRDYAKWRRGPGQSDQRRGRALG